MYVVNPQSYSFVRWRCLICSPATFSPCAGFLQNLHIISGNLIQLYVYVHLIYTQVLASCNFCVYIVLYLYFIVQCYSCALTTIKSSHLQTGAVPTDVTEAEIEQMFKSLCVVDRLNGLFCSLLCSKVNTQVICLAIAR